MGNSAARIMVRLSLLLLVAGGVSTFSSVYAQENSFYKGKTVRIVVGASPGGFYDRWARLFSRYLGNYIPGNPDFIVQNMPGASGLIAANYVYNVAKKDGLSIVMPVGSFYLDQVVGRKEVKFDVRKFQWIGTQEKSNGVLYIRADAPYKSIDDVIKAKAPPKCGTPGTGGFGYAVVKVLEQTVGAKFKLVRGYPGGSEIDVAVERGEVVCRGMSIAPHMGREPFLTWHKKGFDRHLVQTGQKRDRRLPDTPTVYELLEKYHTPDVDRRVAKVIMSSGDFGRPFAVAPGVPRDRVEILRAAYTKSLQDPKLLAETKKGKMDVDPSTGAEVQELANEVINQPSQVIEQVKKVLGG